MKEAVLDTAIVHGEVIVALACRRIAGLAERPHLPVQHLREDTPGVRAHDRPDVSHGAFHEPRPFLETDRGPVGDPVDQNGDVLGGGEGRWIGVLRGCRDALQRGVQARYAAIGARLHLLGRPEGIKERALAVIDGGIPTLQ
jgi:hypothetical protein